MSIADVVELALETDSRDAWRAVVAALPEQQRKILVAIGHQRSLTYLEISSRAFLSENVIAAQISRLAKLGIVETIRSKGSSEPTKVRVLQPGLGLVLGTIGMTELELSKVSSEVSNRVYQSVIGVFEYLENEGLIGAHGHHLAQDVAAVAEEKLKQCWEGGG